MIRLLLPIFIYFLFIISALGQIQYQLFTSDNNSFDYEVGESVTWVASDGGLIKLSEFSSEAEIFNPENSGLQGSEVYEIELAPDGVLWVATKFALQSYNGEDWTSINLELDLFSRISNLRISEEGTVWFLLDSIVYSWDGEVLRNYASYYPDGIRGFDLYTDDLVYLYDDELTAYKFDGEISFEIVTANDFTGNILDGVIDKNGDFIFLTKSQINNSKNLYRYKNNSTISLLRSDANSYYFAAKPSLAFVKDAAENIWLQYFDQYPESTLLLKITDSGIESHDYESLGLDVPNSPGEYILMGLDGSNNFWLRKNTRDEGPKIFKANSSTITSYETYLRDINTGSSYVSSLGEDCDGNIHTLTGKFVSSFDGFNWSSVCFTDLLPPLSTYQYNEDLIVNPINCEMWWDINCTNHEILVLKDGAISFKNIGADVLQMEVGEDGTSYILTRDGLLVIDISGSEQWFPKDALPFNPAGWNSMVLGNDNNLWIHIQQKIFKFKNGNWQTLEPVDHPYVEANWLNIVVDNDARLWTYYEDGFAIYDGVDWELVPFEIIGYYPIMYYQSKENKIWLDVIDGLSIFNSLSFESLNVSNSSISSNWISDIHFAKNGDIWLLHFNGITRMTTRFAESNNKIGGITFYDHNQDGLYDPAEDSRLSNQRVINLDNNEVTYSNSTGGYAFGVDGEVSSEVEIRPDQDWNSVSPSVLNYDVNNSSIFDLDFALYNDQLIPEITFDLVSSPSICNGTTSFWVIIKNEGIETQEGIVGFSFGELFEFEDSNYPTSLQEDAYIELEFENLRFTESKTFVIELSTPNEDNFGDFFSFKASLQTEDMIIEKEIEVEEELLCSYDPNDKLSNSTGESVGEYSLLDDALEYTIRFQNFGNYAARKVVVIDTLDQQLDVNTFELVSYSHDVVTTIVEGNIVIFKFEDINLPFEAEDAPGSNGYVKYRIKAKEDTPPETMVHNSATIYFDYNAGIITNITQNILVNELPISSNDDLTQDNIFTIYPNPSSGAFILDAQATAMTETNITLRDINGKLISSTTTSSFPVSLNVESSGMYIATIQSGDRVYSMKLVRVE